jgi:hypothetical protein
MTQSESRKATNADGSACLTNVPGKSAVCRLEHSFQIAALFLTAIAFVLFLLSALQWFKYCYGNVTESVIATACFSISERPFIYKNFSEGPMTACVYTPVYLYICYLVSWITGKGFLCGRIVTLTAFLVSLGIIYRILRIHKTKRIFALVTVLLAGALGTIHAYTFFTDITALCFNLAGMYFFMRWDRKEKARRSKYFIFGILAFTLAYMTKQSYITGIAAVTLWMLFRGRWRGLLAFLMAQGACIFIPSAFLNIVTHGAYFKNTVIANRVLEYSWRLLALSWVNYGTPARIWFFLVFALLACATRFWQRRALLPDFYFIFALLTTFALGVNGSGDNYFLEMMISSFILFGISFSAAADFNRNSRLAMVLWLIFLAQLGSFYGTGVFSFKSPPRAVIEGKDGMSKIIQKVRGDVLSEDMSLLITNGRKVFYEPYEYNQLARKGLWDESIILNRIRNREFPLVILETNLFGDILQTSRFSLAFTRTLRENYRPYGAFGGYVVAVPK